MARYPLEPGQFQLHISMGSTINDKFDLAEALQQVLEKIERGKKSGVVTDSNGTKVGEFDYI